MIRINSNKRVGQVVYVVEGERKEFTLLTQIYKKIFNYNIVASKRGKITKLYKGENDSIVYIINSASSNIGSMVSARDYLDAKFLELTRDFKLDIRNCFMYYLFDRDYKSNCNAGLIKDLLHTFTNSLSNGVEQSGLLLLSFPCVEAFVVSCFEDGVQYESDAENLKIYLNEMKIQQNKIGEGEIERATRGFLSILRSEFGYEFDIVDIDNFKDKNLMIFDNQEDLFKNNGGYCVLSLFVISLLDLGLIEIVKD